MTAPTQQARAAILVECLRAHDVIRVHQAAHDYVLLNLSPSKHMRAALVAVIEEQELHLSRLEADLAKLEGEAP